MTPANLDEAQTFLDHWARLYPILARYNFSHSSEDGIRFQRAVSTINSEANALLLRMVAATVRNGC